MGEAGEAGEAGGWNDEGAKIQTAVLKNILPVVHFSLNRLQLIFWPLESSGNQL